MMMDEQKTAAGRPRRRSRSIRGLTEPAPPLRGFRRAVSARAGNDRWREGLMRMQIKGGA